jgi:CcmD family protein
MQISPPDNGGYMIAAYVIVSLVTLVYGWSLARRAKREVER